MTDSNKSETLKQLREQRKAYIEKARKMIIEQNKRISDIRSQLKDGPRTVPEIAAALGMDTSDVLITISALRKYGEIMEDAKDGNYFRYRMAEKSA